MRLRIVAGELGGRRISVPARPGLRVTSERVREAWFSALGESIRGATFVDLYAGSGALGMEALSRGAAHVDFVEADTRLVSVLRSNLEKLGLGERGGVFRTEALAFLERSEACRWDVALADPPYRKGAAARLVLRFLDEPFARILCIEHEPEALASELEPWWVRRYGDTELTFLRSGAD